ncbi:MAG: hypothetical protein FWC92_00220 [Defluviitaleaceae bacterium]|nr:hypothetical protein [Defluviitaleaceae bacterium]
MKRKITNSSKVSDVVREFSKDANRFDPQGVYIGEDTGEDIKPIQDADDL